MIPKKLTPIQAIKTWCRYNCCGNSVVDWKECPSEKCPLFPYRLGKRPKVRPFSEYTKKHRDLPLKLSKETIVQPGSDKQKTLQMEVKNE